MSKKIQVVDGITGGRQVAENFAIDILVQRVSTNLILMPGG